MSRSHVWTLGQLSLNALRAFEAVARLGSVAAAAVELGVTAGAVSHQIRGLEERIGVALFERQGRGLVLTAAGARLLPGTRQGFQMLAGAVAEVSRSPEHNVVTLSMVPSLSKWLLTRLGRFTAQAPEIDVRLAASTTLADFRNDRVDLALRYGAGGYRGLHAQRLASISVFPVCAPTLAQGGAPLASPGDLAQHVLIHDESVDIDQTLPDWRAWLDLAGAGGVDAGRGLRLNNGWMAIEAAVAGQGVALVRDMLAADDLASGRLVRPFDLLLPAGWAYWLVAPPEHLRRPAVARLWDWLAEEMTACRQTLDAMTGGGAGARP